MQYTTIPSDDTIQTTADNLIANGITTFIVNTSDEAKQKVAELIPKQSEVFTMTSETLLRTGIAEMINTGQYDSVRNQLNAMDGATQGREMRKLGAAPDFALGSVHAISQNGRLFIASNSGSQLPAYVYGAGTVIWIAGAQKIVTDEDAATKRLYDYVLPLESQRAHKAYGVPGSEVRKLLTINSEGNTDRAIMIIVKEALGY